MSVRVYEVLRDCRDYGLRDQMQRAAVSIASNIAEGAERGGKDFRRFLRIARGSAAELRTQACIARKIGLIDHAAMSELTTECKRLAKMLTALSNSLNTEHRTPNTEH